MATVNFLYRSTKENAHLTLRLLFRHDNKDFVFGVSTKLEVSKHYWTKEHTQKRPKDIDIANRQLEVNKELNNIENHILSAFRDVEVEVISKEWLQQQVELYYNPPQKQKGIPTNLIDYIDFYLDYRKYEIKSTSIATVFLSSPSENIAFPAQTAPYFTTCVSSVLEVPSTSKHTDKVSLL